MLPGKVSPLLKRVTRTFQLSSYLMGPSIVCAVPRRVLKKGVSLGCRARTCHQQILQCCSIREVPVLNPAGAAAAEEQLDAAYQEVSDVQTVGRGVGLWGDMVVTLRNSNKIEMRSLPE